MNRIRLFFYLLTICFSANSQVVSYLPESAIKSVVLLEKKVDSLYIPHGTGFLMLSYDKDKPLFVVTNEHVLRNRFIYVTVPADSELINYLTIRKSKYFTLNGQTWEFLGNKLRLRYELIPDSTFVYNKELDIAAFKIKIGNTISINDSTDLKITNVTGIGLSTVKYNKDIQLGTDIFFIGFPFLIGTEKGWNFSKKFSSNIPSPLVRKGIVAWKSNEEDVFLLDAFSYSGNSGSPIFTINDGQNLTYLIGIVAGHLPSENSDNSGLARCIWIDEVVLLFDKMK